MKWVLQFYEMLFKVVFSVIQKLEHTKEVIVNIIDGFFYQFIVAIISLSVLWYRGIGDQVIECMLGREHVPTPEIALTLGSCVVLPIVIALFIHKTVHHLMRWRGHEERFMTFFSFQEKVLSYGLTFISIITMATSSLSSDANAADINKGAFVFTVIFFYMSLINEIYSHALFNEQQKCRPK